MSQAPDHDSPQRPQWRDLFVEPAWPEPAAEPEEEAVRAATATAPRRHARARGRAGRGSV
ncbi:hypothetical protein [Streptomyces sp. NPDC088923]|uniref:hypothetical protein n=1 Tax=Streptomyces sp. NPDC088923 TaxID=3365913 RepID=UPI0038280406